MNSRLFRTVLGSLCLLSAAACAKKPTAYETLPQLKNALHEPVLSQEQNLQHSQLVELVSEEGHLEGLHRSDVETKIGRGDICQYHKVCREQGFEDDDWYYEVGVKPEEGDGSRLKHLPALIVGFNRFGKVERTFVMRIR